MRIDRRKGKKWESGRVGERCLECFGLLNYFHAFVVFQRVRHRYHSRVIDGVVFETARITQNNGYGIMLVQRECPHRERGGGKRIVGGGG